MRIVLAGGGHGHVNILAELKKNPLKDASITLITDNQKQYYSGMISSFIEGIYSQEETSFDVHRLCSEAGVTYLEAKILAIDKNTKELITDKGLYPYDILSMNLGSSMVENFDIDSDRVIMAKPIGNLVEDFKELKSGLVGYGDRIVFVGGGASGLELAFGSREVFPGANISIISGGKMGHSFNRGSQAKIKKLLAEKKIVAFENEYVEKIKGKKIYSNKNTYDFDWCILTTGFKGPEIVFRGFETSSDNCLVVGDDLKAGTRELAMGDTARLRSYPDLPRAGVFAIRQAPILYKNLRSMAQGKDLVDYRPQKHFLQILNCGNKKALANYKNFHLYSSLSWYLKDYIDRSYMDK